MRDDSSGTRTLGRRSVSRRLAPALPLRAARLEISSVVWIVGICGPTDFDMALDFGAGGFIQGQYLAFARFLGEPDAEDPLGRREVLASLPVGRFVGVASVGPAPELPEDMVVKPGEGSLGGSMPVVIGPTPNNRVELPEEQFLRKSQSGVDAEPDFVPEGFDVTLCGGGQEFVPKLAHGVPQKVEPFVDVGDDGLLL